MFEPKSSLIVPDTDMFGKAVVKPMMPNLVMPPAWAEQLAKTIVAEMQAVFATPGPIPYFPGAAGNLPVTQAQPLPVSQGVAALPPRQAGPPFGLILQMDVVPEYVAKTFHLVERDSGVGYKSELYTVFIEGEDLDTTLRRWLIVYSSHEYHAKRAHELEQQLHDLISGAIVLTLPVVG